MASETRSPFEHVSWLLALRDAPRTFDFHQAMRRLEHAFSDLPRWGEAARPLDEPVRLGQDPELAFSPSAVAEFTPRTEGRLSRLAVTFLGLFGPNGPLPLHLTEYVRDRIRHNGDEALAAFADLFHHRMLTLFHRAWAQGRPAPSRDRRQADRFLLYVGALCGLGLPSLQGPSELQLAKLSYAGVLASDTKHPDGLRALLAGYFDLPVRIQEFVGDWLPLPEAERFQLGYSLRVSALGRTTVLGARVFSRSHKFRVVLGPLRAHQLSRFLPRTRALAQLTELVKAYVGDELDWDLELVPAVGSATQLRLGHAGRLGFDGVLGSVGSPVRRAHVIVNPFSQQTERLLA